MEKKTLRKCLFLDRDGIINEDYGYVHNTENFEFKTGIFELVKVFKKYEFLLIVVTNQSGIGRGYFSEQCFFSLTEYMRSEFLKNDTPIDGIYFCPYFESSPDPKYRVGKDFRKPAPGMLLSAIKDFGIDARRSVMMGDQKSDMLAGYRAGIKRLICVNQNYRCSLNERKLTSGVGKILRFSTLSAVIPWAETFFLEEQDEKH